MPQVENLKTDSWIQVHVIAQLVQRLACLGRTVWVESPLFAALYQLQTARRAQSEDSNG